MGKARAVLSKILALLFAAKFPLCVVDKAVHGALAMARELGELTAQLVNVEIRIVANVHDFGLAFNTGVIG